MKNNEKNLIVTITKGGTPAFATECKLFAGVALLGEYGPVHGLVLGSASDIEEAITVAALYRLCEETVKKHGKEFKKLVKEARKHEKVVK